MDAALDYHFLEEMNTEIERLSLPALEPLAKRKRMDYVNESLNSKVCSAFLKYILSLHSFTFRLNLSIEFVWFVNIVLTIFAGF